MKKSLLSVILMIVMIVSYGQDYHPFLQNVGWCLEEYIGTGSVMNAYTHKSDTTIGGLDYAKLMKGGTLFLVREDAALRKIWVILPGSSAETLLYDFSVSPGTQVTLHYAGNIAVLYTVDSIDSISTPLGSRKRINLSTTDTVFSPALTWIEGAGSVYGPVYLYDPTYAPGVMSLGHCLICAYHGIGQQSYSGACGIPCIGYTGSPCYSFIAGIQETKDDHAKINIETITPGLIRVQLSRGVIKELRVISIEGKLLKTIRDQGKDELFIQTDGWITGIYLIEVTSENGSHVTTKISL